MDQQNLEPGDTVISLGDLTVTITIIAGGINVAIILWQINQPWWLSIIGFFSVVLIWVLAKLTGLLLFLEKDYYVTVVKAGESALPATLKAAFIGALIALLVFGIPVAYVLGGLELVETTWPLIAIASFVMGAIWATLAALV